LKTLDDGKATHVHELAELVLWKWLYYQEECTDSMKPTIKFLCHFLQKPKMYPKTHMEAWKIQIVKAILSKKSNARVITIPDFNLYYRTIVKKNKINQQGTGTQTDL
jgi:hypothetical protein